MTVAAAIVAGGQGLRMGGIAKGLLQVGGLSIVEAQLRLLRPLFSRVFIVTNDAQAYSHLGVPLVADQMGAGLGPLAGVQSALSFLLPHEDAVTCVAADMPFLSAPIMRLIRDCLADAAGLVPFLNGFPEPLCARYHRRVLPVITDLIQRGRLKCSDALLAINASRLPDDLWQAIDPTGRFATNINTPAALEAAVLATKAT